MSQIAYTVACTFTDPDVAEAWAAWLRDGHLADVCAAGAIEAHAVKMDGPVIRYEARYRFASREAFEAYERDHAPRLRAEGLAKFPLEMGLQYERTVGEVVSSVAPS
ncbi:MAG: DUF4286 family protein [Acidobacteriota bacterium]